MIDKDSLIYVAGHKGMVGSAILRRLKIGGYENTIVKSSSDLDLRRQVDVEEFFMKNTPEVVFLAAAKVGGIHANNTYRADFIYENLAIQTNVINAAFVSGVKNLIFFSSSCVYPRNSPQPMSEDYLWSGALEPTNEPYAVAKLAGMSMCQAYNQQYGTRYISVLPTNIYGENDSYHPENAHVVGALFNKFHQAKQHDLPVVTLWGSGTPRRELLYVDDVADAAIYLFEKYTGVSPVNIGYGSDIEIKELAIEIKKIVGYEGSIEYDSAKPDGAPRKLLSNTILSDLGWSPATPLNKGLARTYQYYQDQL